MKKTSLLRSLVITGIFGCAFGAIGVCALRDNPSYATPTENSGSDTSSSVAELENVDGAAGEAIALDSKTPGKKSVPKKKKRVFSGEEAFIAGPDWEFDGFVVGGQDQEVKSMFVVNDLIYLNVGLSHGFKSGQRLGIYKRGDRVRDPQSGRFLGYQVKRVATVEITNKIDDETCSVRVINANTGIEVGDLVRQDR